MDIDNTFRYPKLRGRIIEKYRSYADFANAIGEHKTVVSRKLNGNIGFTKKDIIDWCRTLEIPPEDIGVYFFDELVNQTLTSVG